MSNDASTISHFQTLAKWAEGMRLSVECLPNPIEPVIRVKEGPMILVEATDLAMITGFLEGWNQRGKWEKTQ